MSDLSRAYAEATPIGDSPLALDRQRIIHSAAFRRLQYKTQVFVATEQDHFRTRLTHTLEVANLARLVATRIAAACAGVPPHAGTPPTAARDPQTNALSERSAPQPLTPNPDLAEVVALAHDLGHPPFGHAGERALAECMKDHGGFEHNVQSLRVVEYLEHPYPAFRGLNLTRVVRECLAKHSTAFDKPAWHPLQDGLPAPPEGQIADVADRLAYGLHDLQDGIYAGLIEREDLERVTLWKQAYAGPPAGSGEKWWGHIRPTIDRIQEILVDDMLSVALRDPAIRAPATHDPAKPATAENSIGRSPTARRVASVPPNAEKPLAVSADAAMSVGGASPSAEKSISGWPSEKNRPGVSSDAEKSISVSPQMESQIREMEHLLSTAVYRNHKLRRMDSKARRIVTTVFAAYVAEPELMPERYLSRVPEQGVHRVAADYIAGMTDRFCIREHTRLFDPRMDV